MASRIRSRESQARRSVSHESGQSASSAYLCVVALNRHALDVCLVPITTQQHANFSMRVPLKSGDGGLDQDCWAKCDQVITVEKTYLHPKPLGTISVRKLAEIEQQVKVALGLL